MFPELIPIPFLGQSIHSYGVLIAAGFVLASLYIARDARLAGRPKPSMYTDLAFHCLIVGLVGSRILFIIVNWRLYWANPIELLYFWRGGLVFYGGFLLALVYAVWWCKRNGEKFFDVADRLIPGVALNHVFGRIGCLAAGCCFGAPARIGLTYPPGSPAQVMHHNLGFVDAWAPSLRVHASPVYEAIGELAIFALLWWLRSRKKFDGQLLLVWLALYPILRSVVEMTRGDIERGFVIPGILSVSQAISIFVAALAAVIYFTRIRHVGAAAAPVERTSN